MEKIASGEAEKDKSNTEVNQTPNNLNNEKVSVVEDNNDKNISNIKDMNSREQSNNHLIY